MSQLKRINYGFPKIVTQRSPRYGAEHPDLPTRNRFADPLIGQQDGLI